jgi:hypothetical protein
MGIAHGDIICFIEFHGGQQWNDCRIVMEEAFHGIAMDKCQMWMIAHLCRVGLFVCLSVCLSACFFLCFMYLFFFRLSSLLMFFA